MPKMSVEIETPEEFEGWNAKADYNIHLMDDGSLMVHGPINISYHSKPDDIAMESFVSLTDDKMGKTWRFVVGYKDVPMSTIDGYSESAKHAIKICEVIMDDWRMEESLE